MKQVTLKKIQVLGGAPRSPKVEVVVLAGNEIGTILKQSPKAGK